jgi:ppGpp synthetase/RelA/SpoT-type nucleotidyltranferase
MLDEKVNEFIENSQEVLSDKKDSLEQEKQNIINYIQQYFLDLCPLKNIAINGRVKGTTSLREKIIRKRYFNKYKDADGFIENLPDLIGLRLVCLLNIQESEVFNELKMCFLKQSSGKYFITNNCDTTKPFLRINLVDRQPERQKNKLEIYRIACQWVISETNIINVELQIKSLVNNLWGEIEHMLFYKNYAYVIGADFYKNIMDTILNELETVDTQLAIMKSHLTPGNLEIQKQEIKQMLGKLIFNTYAPFIKQSMECDIDLREIYDLIIEILFQKAKGTEQITIRLGRIVEKLNSKGNVIDKSIFEFGDYDPKKIMHPQYPDLSKILMELGKSNDIFWIVFIGLYNKLVLESEDYAIIINRLSEDLMNFFMPFTDSIEIENDDSVNILKVGIIYGIIDAFDKYKKIDYFIPMAHGNNILERVTAFVNSYQYDFEFADGELDEDKENKINDTINHIVFVISMIIRGELELEISKDELIKLKESAANINILWQPAIDSNKLDALISKENIDCNELEDLFNLI